MVFAARQGGSTDGTIERNGGDRYRCGARHGATYAKALAAEGARVSLCDLDPPDAAVLAIREAGGAAIAQVCDVGDPKAVAALVQATEGAFGVERVPAHHRRMLTPEKLALYGDGGAAKRLCRLD